ncbi:MAG: hypothetical protein K5990_00390, partial [Oscillospiraceae bacterium]|nr:hypothetical protein [Oscillospiraceae bacterium]
EPERNVDMKRYNKISELPDWAREPVKRLCALGVLHGRGGLPDEEGYPTGLDLSYELLRMAVMLDRATGG